MGLRYFADSIGLSSTLGVIGVGMGRSRGASTNFRQPLLIALRSVGIPAMAPPVVTDRCASYSRDQLLRLYSAAGRVSDPVAARIRCLGLHAVCRLRHLRRHDRVSPVVSSSPSLQDAYQTPSASAAVAARARNSSCAPLTSLGTAEQRGCFLLPKHSVSAWAASLMNYLTCVVIS